MKVLALLALCIILPSQSIATPITSATIFQQGNDYSAKGGRWFEPTGQNFIRTYWSRQWVEYTAFLTPGRWTIGLNVKNYGNLGSNWYDSFKVRSSVNNDLLSITASQTEAFYDFTTFDVTSSDLLTVRYTWLNDKWGGRNDPLRRDANIQIESAFFNRVPVANSLLLFCLGALLFSYRQTLFSQTSTLKNHSRVTKVYRDKNV